MPVSRKKTVHPPSVYNKTHQYTTPKNKVTKLKFSIEFWKFVGDDINDIDEKRDYELIENHNNDINLDWLSENCPDGSYSVLSTTITRLNKGNKWGKASTRKPTIIKKGVNLGKKNATNAFTQGLSRLGTKYDKLMKEYFGDITMKKPQHAGKFTEGMVKDWNNWVAQYKFDGQRCIIYNTENGVKHYSRGKVMDIYNIPHITSQFEELPYNTYLDGELYLHGTSLQNIRKGITNGDSFNKAIEFHVFTIFYSDKTPPLSERMETLKEYKENYKYSKKIVFVDSFKMNSRKEMELLMTTAIGKGYEGLMLKKLTGTYVHADTNNVVKYKYKYEMEVELIGTELAENGEHKGSIMFICKTSFNDGNKTFRVTPSYPLAERREIAKKFKKQSTKDKYLGQMITITYMGLSDEKIPQHTFAKKKSITKHLPLKYDNMFN